MTRNILERDDGTQRERNYESDFVKKELKALRQELEEIKLAVENLRHMETPEVTAVSERVGVMEARLKKLELQCPE